MCYCCYQQLQSSDRWVLHGHLDKLEQEGHGKVQTAKKQEYRESRMTDDQFHK